MTALETMRAFVESFPDFDVLSRFDIDYTDKVPNSAGLFPAGLVEIRRQPDVLGNVEVDNQLNFALYQTLEKYEDATDNAEWQMAFQAWVQEQSVRHLAPTFGDYPLREHIAAQNGAIFSASDEGTAVYVIHLSVTFTKRYEREDT